MGALRGPRTSSAVWKLTAMVILVEETEAVKKELMARKEAAKKREEERARVMEEKAKAKEERKKARREEIAMIEAQTARSLEVIKETKKLHAVLRRRIAVETVEVEAQKIEREVLKARNAEIKAETRMYKNELLEIYLYRWIADLD